ncbi:MAG: hypothetical protein HN742_23325 [Lentisphaerae bacterium]|nr:hypothetical protein [Lentisphaerota bacterium]MBT4816120.1 hypothetical protein [Lentisphaerota bacterium]MBT5608404.1 hypothetical protein [Lentisphaerota bacterium]MBT7054976.1 hypothetical protein [Lentisphaerota bacterium]MBT7844827.1 hypothetical protein [Lentisphaerota bacterium]
MKLPILLPALFFAFVTAAELPDGWVARDQATWSTPSPGFLRQASRTPALAAKADLAPGNCWRCTIVPGPWDGSAGLHFATAPDGTGGLALLLEYADGEPGLFLRDGTGAVLWADAYMGWMPYGPLHIEAVTAESKLYVQALRVADNEPLAQSEWLPIEVPRGNGIALVTGGNSATFTGWGRADVALHKPDPNSPSRLRLQQHGETAWKAVGNGNWQWEDHTCKTLLQKQNVERTTAFITTPRSPSGTWRCRILLKKNTCGGGMAMLADADQEKGFLCWLGGRYGDGGLMLYRYPLTSLWSSPQGKWHWDTEYVLEGNVANGKIAVRMLAADGETVIAESPQKDLLPEELGRSGMTGFQTWRGTGRFRDFSAETRVGAAPATGATSPTDIRLSGGWNVRSGSWEDRPAAAGKSGSIHQTQAAGQALCSATAGARGTFSVDALPGKGTERISLLFQVDKELQEGFELRIDQGCELRTMDGDVLWKAPGRVLRDGQQLTLEGIVLTDRVQVRISDSTGNELAKSPDCYVPDTNNTRSGFLGVSCTGPAKFTNWQWRAE